MIWLIDALLNGLRAARNLLARALASRGLAAIIVDLEGPFPERTAPRRPWPQRLMSFGWRPAGESLEELRARFERIAGARGSPGVILRVRELQAGLATVQSLRAAVADLRARGVRVVAYLPGADLRSFYLATAADEIVMPPAAFWHVTGLRAEITFLRDAFDRVGLRPEFERIAEYKTAADPFMRSQMSDAHREMVDSILDAILDEIVGDVAQTRELDPKAVRAAMDHAPLSAEDALGSGLIDAVAYEDELGERLGTEEAPAAIRPWVHAQRSLPIPYRWRARTPAIAVVQVVGGIVPGESRRMPLPLPVVGGAVAGSDSVARAFRAAERHPAVRAIVLHVESPGGSALGSDLIWREVGRIKASKPVVVYMGDVAGSGGYYVACGANAIVAQPFTLTGSIGVVGGKVTAHGLYQRLGLNREIIARGTGATLTSAFAPYTPDQLERVRREMHMIYTRFIGLVASGRGRDLAEIDTIGRGRVWTGRQALERGLIDDVGDFARAVRRAADLAGIPDGRRVDAITIHPPRATSVPAAPAEAVIDAIGAVRRLADEAGLLLMHDIRLIG
jgi:protease-4